MSDIPHYFLYGEKSSNDAVKYVHIASLEESLPKHHWEIHPHRHDNMHQLLIVEQGHLLAQIEEHHYKEKGPCMLSIPPKKVHGFVHQPDVRGYIVTITSTFLAQLFNETERQEFALLFHQPLISRPQPDSRIAWCMEHLAPQLMSEYKLLEVGQYSMIGAYLKMFLILLYRALKPTQHSGKHQDAKIILYEQFMTLLEEHYDELWSVSKYAAELNLSTTKLNQLCQQYSGQNALEIVHDHLLTEAKRQLIYTQLSAKEIAYKLGFKDTGYFSRFFKRKTGMTAGKFRKKIHTQRNSS